MSGRSSVSLSMRRALVVGVSYANEIAAGRIVISPAGTLFSLESDLQNRMASDEALIRETDGSFRVLRVI